MIRSVLILVASFTVSVIASAWLHVHDLTLVIAVIWPAAGIVAGVLIGAVVFVVQSMPHIQEKVIVAFIESQQRYEQQLTSSQKGYIRNMFAKSRKDIQQNVLVVLLTLAVLAASTWWAYADIPYLTWPIIAPISKVQAVHAIAFFMFTIILYAAWDTLSSMFLCSTLESESTPTEHQGPTPFRGKPAGE
ncbi:MAG: hypothetical protein IT445_14020 [Phycisphaeraceae bacterium]|nr:hypothetical protein [Phycisphaeraceae bacterium]